MESKQFASFQKAVVRDEILLRLRNSDSKDVSSWTDLVRYDVIKCVTLSPGDTSEWKQIAQIADKAIHSYRDLFKQFPSHFVSIVLDHARCLLQFATNSEIKKALFTLRSCPQVKNCWDFYKMLLIVEIRQGDIESIERILTTSRSIHASHPEHQEANKLISSHHATPELMSKLRQLVKSFAIFDLTHSAVHGSTAYDRCIQPFEQKDANSMSTLNNSYFSKISINEPMHAAPPAERSGYHRETYLITPRVPHVDITETHHENFAATIRKAHTQNTTVLSFNTADEPIPISRSASRENSVSNSEEINTNTQNTSQRPQTVTTSAPPSKPVFVVPDYIRNFDAASRFRSKVLTSLLKPATTLEVNSFNIKQQESLPPLSNLHDVTAGPYARPREPRQGHSTNSPRSPPMKRQFVSSQPLSMQSHAPSASGTDPSTNLVDTSHPTQSNTQQNAHYGYSRKAEINTQSVEQPVSHSMQPSTADVPQPTSSLYASMSLVDSSFENSSFMEDEPDYPSEAFAPASVSVAPVETGSILSALQSEPEAAAEKTAASTQLPKFTAVPPTINPLSVNSAISIPPPPCLPQAQNSAINSTAPTSVNVPSPSLAAQTAASKASANTCVSTQRVVPFPLPNGLLTPSPYLESFLHAYSASGSADALVRVNQRPYLRLACIGKGGSSRVYRVLAQDGNVYALKRVRLTRSSLETIESYQNEITLLQSLAGQRHIISLIDAEVDIPGRLIQIVMELGHSDLACTLSREKLRIEERMKHLSSPPRNNGFGAPSQSTFPPYLCTDPVLLRLVWQSMLEAVDTIHEARIVHGDLKPANFIFGNGGTLKLIDFGIAKAIPREDTTHIVREGTMGTLNYMSPEAIQAHNHTGPLCSSAGSTPILKLGRSSDIWSLGCILYQMAFGKTPFADLPLIPKLQAICDANHTIAYPTREELQHMEAPPGLVEVIESCLQRNASLRPSIRGPKGLLNHEFLKPKHQTMGEPAIPRSLKPSTACALCTPGRGAEMVCLRCHEKALEQYHAVLRAQGLTRDVTHDPIHGFSLNGENGWLDNHEKIVSRDHPNAGKPLSILPRNAAAKLEDRKGNSDGSILPIQSFPNRITL